MYHAYSCLPNRRGSPLIQFSDFCRPPHAYSGLPAYLFLKFLPTSLFIPTSSTIKFWLLTQQKRQNRISVSREKYFLVTMTMPLSDVTLIRLINPLIKSIMLSCKVEYNNIVISYMRDDLICQAPWLFQPPFLLVHGYFAMLPYYSVLPYYLILQEMPGSLFIPTSPSIREIRVCEDKCENIILFWTWN